jgi:hypothetical protein
MHTYERILLLLECINRNLSYYLAEEPFWCLICDFMVLYSIVKVDEFNCTLPLSIGLWLQGENKWDALWC